VFVNLSDFLSVTAFVLGLSGMILAIVGFHELGHFLVAKYFKIRVERVSIGFGRVLWQRIDAQGTEYVLSAVPLGGYVTLMDSRTRSLAPHERNLALDSKPYYQRCLVLLAGPCANFLFAWLAYWLVFSTGFITVQPIIGSVLPNSIAAQSGLKTGDRIMRINKDESATWMRINFRLLMLYGHASFVNLNFVRPPSQEIKTIRLSLDQWKLDPLQPNPLLSLGIIPHQFHGRLLKKDFSEIKLIRYSFFSAAYHALEQLLFFIQFHGRLLYQLLSGALSWHGLSGPIGILSTLSSSIHQGWITFISFLALLSISVGVINLLPIPGLDGSQIFYVLYEWIFKRPVSIRMQILVFRIAAAVLGVFFIQVISNDVLRLIHDTQLR